MFLKLFDVAINTRFIIMRSRHPFLSSITSAYSSRQHLVSALSWCTYKVHTISFKTFSLEAFTIVKDSWKFTMLLLYILWDDWPTFTISGSNEQLLQQLEYTLLKPDCHSWWISKMQSDTLGERYAIKFCFKLGKNAIEIYGMLQSRQFLSLPIVQTLLPVTFAYSLSSQDIVMRQLGRWKRLWRRSLTRSHKWTSMGPSRSCCSRRRLLRRRLEFHVSTINKSAHTKNVWKVIVCTLHVGVKIRTSLVSPWGGARGVMVIVTGYGHGDTSSIPGQDWLHFT